MPKISILVPIYNVEKYLRECIDSLVNQTLQDIEIICINDGSTDNSLAILEEYEQKDSRIKIINKENSGYGASMNMGLNAATGDYIGIVESDDFAQLNMFEDLYTIAIENNIDIVKSDFFNYTTANNKSVKAGKIDKCISNKVINAKVHTDLLRIQPSIWSAIYKKSFLDENHIRFLETPGASYQDTSFAFKTTSLAERIYLTDKAYINYRQDNVNSSVKSKDKVFAICEEYNEITNFLNKNPELKSKLNSTKLIMQFNAYLWNIKRIDESLRDSFIIHFSNVFNDFHQKNELDAIFYLRTRKKKIDLLLKDPSKFSIYCKKLIDRDKNKQKLFSIRLNSCKIRIVLFGKTIIDK